MYKKLQNDERVIKEISFDSNTESLKQHCLDIFEGVKPDVMYTTQYDENSNIGKTYLRMPKIRRQDELKVEQKAPCNRRLLYIPGKPLDGTDCKILLDTGT